MKLGTGTTSQFEIDGITIDQTEVVAFAGGASSNSVFVTITP